jgi:hypothetical protein
MAVSIPQLKAVPIVRRYFKVRALSDLYVEAACAAAEESHNIEVHLMCTDDSPHFELTPFMVVSLRKTFAFPIRVFLETEPREQETASTESGDSSVAQPPEAVSKVR